MLFSKVPSAALVVASALGAAVPRTNLTDLTARCMDGTLSAFYHQPAPTGGATSKWIFFLEGGGECATQSACDNALKSPLGSSNYFQQELYMGYFLSDNQASNPDFWDWNHVDVPYCSQDLHSGTVTQPSNETWGLYFSGHLVFKAILDALEASANLGQATEIILTGASAGGIGVWINVDYLADRYPNARVTAVPIAGFYFYAYPYQGINHTSSGLADFRPQAWPQHYSLWQSFADETCVAARTADPWACLLANYSYPYIASEAFVVEAQTDQVVLEDHDWLPGEWRTQAPEHAYMQAWSLNMTNALSPLMAPSNKRNGVFNPACYIHTSFALNSPLINGTNYQTALGDWYFGRGNAQNWKLQDHCGVECNPSCP